ncbi:MAG: hypothetical protein VR71_10520 [Roseovarius sp. BRH_c41]|uniref:hypothetical protein n=1 Tax=Roseovarius sp. BRH_c41 TaxID=1629709 RepID=UPI0005F25685|nr:hypothetical protein [Roseovarius sp. BRH_c41]KJS43406.1 MAG: hypothetical protein VR71_10520 [Roseovarius sp. BRH_c41]
MTRVAYESNGGPVVDGVRAIHAWNAALMAAVDLLEKYERPNISLKTLSSDSFGAGQLDLAATLKRELRALKL